MLRGLSLTEVSHVIALATAPAFLLGAVVGFLSLLITRAGRISDRMRVVDEAASDHLLAGAAEAERLRLRHRARLVHVSLALSCLSGGATALLVIVAFLGALANMSSETTVASLFVLSLLAFTAAIYLFAHEAILSLGEFRPSPR